MKELRNAKLAIRVASKAPVPVLVQYLRADGSPCYPEFTVPPGGTHITIRPDGFDQVQSWSSRPRISRFVTVDAGLWLDGTFYIVPDNFSATPGAAP